MSLNFLSFDTDEVDDDTSKLIDIGRDLFVSNGYCHKKHNHHKSYGYLRTVAAVKYLNDFLAT